MSLKKVAFYSVIVFSMLLVSVVAGVGIANAGHNSDDLVGYWPGDGTVADLSGHGNNAILTSGAGFGSGKVGQAFSLDGVNDEIRVPAAAVLDVGDEITISAWVFPTGSAAPFAGSGPIVEYRNGVHFWSHPVQTVLYANLVDEFGVNHTLQTASGVLSLNQFSHVAVTYSKASGIARSYRSGELVATASLGSFNLRTNGDVNIGRRPAFTVFGTTATFNGRIDEVRIYHRALSESEIRTLALVAYPWGNNRFGQLGNNTLGSTQNPDPGLMFNLSNITKLAGGDAHTVALRADGTVWTSGNNARGQLGVGSTSPTNAGGPRQVIGVGGIGFLSDVVDIAAGADHNLALKRDGRVVAWGRNELGQLGIGFSTLLTNPITTPTMVVGPGGSGELTGIESLSAGGYHSLALTNDGSLWSWGFNWAGQLGDGTTSIRNSPVAVSGLNVVDMAAGFYHSVAVLSDHTVKAWGYNGFGQVGDGSTVNRLLPVTVTGLADVGGVPRAITIAWRSFRPTGLLGPGDWLPVDSLVGISPALQVPSRSRPAT